MSALVKTFSDVISLVRDVSHWPASFPRDTAAVRVTQVAHLLGHMRGIIGQSAHHARTFVPDFGGTQDGSDGFQPIARNLDGSAT